jgi:chemotaxis protein MotD
MLQVIDTVQKLAAADGTGAAADPSAATLTSSAPSTRSMTLVLEPENMGTVTVTMQMRGTSLDLQLDVANPQTLALLNKDRDSLSAAMASQDYAIGSLTLRAGDLQTTSTGTHDGAQYQSQGNSGQGANQSSSNGSSSGGASQGGASYSGNGGAGTGASGSTRAVVDADSAVSGAASGVYI